jgi:hypothetical protein
LVFIKRDWYSQDRLDRNIRRKTSSILILKKIFKIEREANMSTQPRSATQLVDMISEDPGLRARLHESPDPVPILRDAANKAEKIVPKYTEDIFLYRIAILVLGSLALIAAIGAIVLEMTNNDIPQVLVALGSAAVGALVGLFAPAPTPQ